MRDEKSRYEREVRRNGKEVSFSNRFKRLKSFRLRFSRVSIKLHVVELSSSVQSSMSHLVESAYLLAKYPQTRPAYYSSCPKCYETIGKVFYSDFVMYNLSQTSEPSQATRLMIALDPCQVPGHHPERNTK